MYYYTIKQILIFTILCYIDAAREQSTRKHPAAFDDGRFRIGVTRPNCVPCLRWTKTRPSSTNYTKLLTKYYNKIVQYKNWNFNYMHKTQWKCVLVVPRHERPTARGRRGHRWKRFRFLYFCRCFRRSTISRFFWNTSHHGCFLLFLIKKNLFLYNFYCKKICSFWTSTRDSKMIFCYELFKESKPTCAM